MLEELVWPLLIAAIGYVLGRAHARFERNELQALRHIEHELSYPKDDGPGDTHRPVTVQAGARPRAARGPRRKLSDQQEPEQTVAERTSARAATPSPRRGPARTGTSNTWRPVAPARLAELAWRDRAAPGSVGLRLYIDFVHDATCLRR